MPKSRRSYPPELRRRLVEVVRAGRGPTEQFEPSAQGIRNWVKQAEGDGGKRQSGLKTGENEDLGRLRGDGRTLREEQGGSWEKLRLGSRGRAERSRTLSVQSLTGKALG